MVKTRQASAKRRSARLQATSKRPKTNGRSRDRTSKNCEVCQYILSALTRPLHLRRDRTYNLATSQQWLDTKCETHLKFITQCLGVDLKSARQYTWIEIHEYTNENFIYIEAWGGGLARKSRTLRLLSASRYASTVWERLVDSDWIDLGLPQRWKWRCDKTHTCSSTHNLGHLTAERPSWVVDTWLQCLVPCSLSITYVALSYVWGGIPIFKTLKENINQLQKPSSLAEGNTSPPIPRTIRHAMSFVQRLGERYLWVDTLCIVQDDAQSIEIAKMAAIYANASVTIIASDGVDADSGLLGLRGISAPRSVEQVVYPFTRGVAAIETYGPDHFLEDTIWCTRGWTLQEALFSRRRVIFEHGWIRWECRCAIWHEFSDANHLDKHVELMRYSPGIFAVAKEVLNMRRLSDIIREYNGKDLTFPEDALFAFSGIASALSRTYDGFISGLPVLLFHIGLLWIPEEALSRRIPEQSGTDHCLPSWSWAGWKGAVSCQTKLAGDFIKKCSTRGSYDPPVEKAFPLVQWNWLQEKNGTPTCIQDAWFEYKNRFWNKLTASCPTGWTRHRIANPETISDQQAFTQPEPGIVPLCFYTHESEPESEFWYPLPSPEPNQPTKTQIFAPFITCKTRRGWLVASETLHSDEVEEYTYVSLRDQVGTCIIGTLETDEPFNPQVERDADDWAGIELVEVALGRAYKHDSYVEWPPEESDLDEWSGGDLFYEYYYVLWIEWRDGIAYRKGLGRVDKNAWEARQREWIDLVLG
ncbi:HET-domain-containing protein [Hypoxylon cercidicola]|nr:HET-domain-containing protein [Hypoxylon cercidicola]